MPHRKRRGSSIRLQRVSGMIGDVAAEISSVHFSSFYHPTAWRPHVNAYRCKDSIQICVDLAGVPKSAISVSVKGRRLRICGVRDTPLPPVRDAESCCRRILLMEIENGSFERDINLPDEVDASAISARHDDGLLWIELPVQSGSQEKPS